MPATPQPSDELTARCHLLESDWGGDSATKEDPGSPALFSGDSAHAVRPLPPRPMIIPNHFENSLLRHHITEIDVIRPEFAAVVARGDIRDTR
jgi:hypothetical protein